VLRETAVFFPAFFKTSPNVFAERIRIVRAQPTKLQTGSKKRRLLLFSSAALILLLAAGAVYAKEYKPPYVPPAWEENAVSGVPEPEESLNFGTIEVDGGFSFALAGTMYQQKDGSLLLYFTNPEDSGVLMMCEICEKSTGEILYQSGLLSPGQYVGRLRPQHTLKNEAIIIEMKVYGFEPETYYSMGTVTLENTLQPW